MQRGAYDDPTYEGLEITSAKPPQTFGHSHLAFTIEIAGSSDRIYGTRHNVFIFRKRGAEWLILRLDRNAILATPVGGILDLADKTAARRCQSKFYTACSRTRAG
jgi:hypothetical protein